MFSDKVCNCPLNKYILHISVMTYVRRCLRKCHHNSRNKIELNFVHIWALDFSK